MKTAEAIRLAIQQAGIDDAKISELQRLIEEAVKTGKLDKAKAEAVLLSFIAAKDSVLKKSVAHKALAARQARQLIGKIGIASYFAKLEKALSKKDKQAAALALREFRPAEFARHAIKEASRAMVETIANEEEDVYYVWGLSDAADKDPVHLARVGTAWKAGSPSPFGDLPGDRWGCQCHLLIVKGAANAGVIKKFAKQEAKPFKEAA